MTYTVGNNSCASVSVALTILSYFRAFDHLWERHSMNKVQEDDDKDGKFDNDEINVYTLNEDQLWTRSELEEMRKPKSSQAKKSSGGLVQTEDMERQPKTAPKKKAPRVKTQGTNSGAESQPDFYHGVGPFNDVNLPGVWFFRIPHKECKVKVRLKSHGPHRGSMKQVGALLPPPPPSGNPLDGMLVPQRATTH